MECKDYCDHYSRHLYYPRQDESVLCQLLLTCSLPRSGNRVIEADGHLINVSAQSPALEHMEVRKILFFVFQVFV